MLGTAENHAIGKALTPYTPNTHTTVDIVAWLGRQGLDLSNIAGAEDEDLQPLSKALEADLADFERSGLEKWLRLYGVIVPVYYGVGYLIYHNLEGWGLLDCVYYLTTTLTTVGYGRIGSRSSVPTAISDGMTVYFYYRPKVFLCTVRRLSHGLSRPCMSHDIHIV